MIATEHPRALVLTNLLAGRLTNAQAARELRLSVRQVRRLKGAFAREGPAALVHGNRGRRPAHRLPDGLRARLVDLATTTYAGCSRLRLCRLLAEREQIRVTPSTLRRVLLAAGVHSRHEARARPLPSGSMPIAFDLVQRRVKLVELKGADYREPSFQQTVDRWRRERPEAVSFELDLEAFAAAAAAEPGRPPDGLLFSVGRCGASLLANMLSIPDEHLVIKESPAVNALLAGLLNVADEPLRREREVLLGRALPFMFRPTRGTERRLLFKLSSWNICLAGTLLRLFPATPAVFLHRSVGETVASMLADPPGWQHLASRPRATQARVFPTLTAVPAQAQLTAAAFYAHAWRSAVETALSLPPERVLMVEYDELLAGRASTLERLLAHLGLAVEPAIRSAMLLTQTDYSERVTGSATLDPSRAAEVVASVDDLPQRLAARHGLQGQRA
jgi:hypothetical protein